MTDPTASTTAASADRRPGLSLDARTYSRALDCVHCGLCLPACPTYTENGEEADSPRGRIYLMKALADGRIVPNDSAVRHLDLCLDCRACETACPSGVVYHELIEETRAKLADRRKRTPIDRLIDAMFYRVFPYPTRVRLAMLPARLLQKLGLWGAMTRLGAKLGGEKIDKMQAMLPADGPLWEGRLAARYPAAGERKLTVGFLEGCIGSAVFQATNRRAIELLCHLGCEVRVPRAQRCCGAIHHHGGKPTEAEAFAKANIEAFADCDAIVTDVAGCGAMLKEYDHLLRDDAAWADRAGAFVAKVRDVSEVLVAIEPPAPPHRVEMTVTYHDACHLAHAQKVTQPPRQLLGMVPGLTVIDLPESDMCCGAAGTYNLSQPAMARRLGERKVGHVRATRADACVTGNVGCAMQIASEARRLGDRFDVVHPVDILHRAYLGA